MDLLHVAADGEPYVAGDPRLHLLGRRSPPGGEAGLVYGRVLGVMPHPDRSYLPIHMPNWRRTQLELGELPLDGDGMVVFREMVKIAKAEG